MWLPPRCLQEHIKAKRRKPHGMRHQQKQGPWVLHDSSSYSHVSHTGHCAPLLWQKPRDAVVVEEPATTEQGMLDIAYYTILNETLHYIERQPLRRSRHVNSRVNDLACWIPNTSQFLPCPTHICSILTIMLHSTGRGPAMLLSSSDLGRVVIMRTVSC